MSHPLPSPAFDSFVGQLIAQHGGRAVIGLAEAAKIAGVSTDLAYDLASEGRFPVFRATRSEARREALRVLIPALVQWMLDGGTAQYRAPSAASRRTDRAAPRRASAAADLSRLERVRAARTAQARATR